MCVGEVASLHLNKMARLAKSKEKEFIWYSVEVIWASSTPEAPNRVIVGFGSSLRFRIFERI